MLNFYEILDNTKLFIDLTCNKYFSVLKCINFYHLFKLKGKICSGQGHKPHLLFCTKAC